MSVEEVMALRCSVVHKNLSAFLDNQLDIEKRRQVEQHLLECSDCLRKKNELQDIVSHIGNLSIPSVSSRQWEDVHHKLIINIEHIPVKTRLFKFPKWAFAPAGAFVLALLIYLAINIFPLGSQQSSPLSVDVCLQEHSMLYSEQIFPTGILPEFAFTETDQTAQEDNSDEQDSDLDMLMEAHYGIN
jgi:hypothetical protein